MAAACPSFVNIACALWADDIWRYLHTCSNEGDRITNKNIEMENEMRDTHSISDALGSATASEQLAMPRSKANQRGKARYFFKSNRKTSAPVLGSPTCTWHQGLEKQNKQMQNCCRCTDIHGTSCMLQHPSSSQSVVHKYLNNPTNASVWLFDQKPALCHGHCR